MNYRTQKISNSIGDWVRMVEADKTELNISLTDREIQGVSKIRFVKKKVAANMAKYLNCIKQTHSKVKHLTCNKIKTADYLKSSRLTTREKQLLFKLRSKTVNVKMNFPGAYKIPWCQF